MATADSVKAKLQGLINLANNTTGKADTDLTAAVDALIAGFGQGGSSGGASGIYMAKITLASDNNYLTITHNLGTTDILFAMAAAEALGDITPTFTCALGKAWAKTSIPNNRNGNGFCWYAVYNTANKYATMNSPTSNSYWDGVKDENTFLFSLAGSAKSHYIAGVTYNVVIVAANAEV